MERDDGMTNLLCLTIRDSAGTESVIILEHVAVKHV